MVEIARRLFTVDDYYRMAEAGILRPDERVELIEGEVAKMAPIGSLHASVVDRLTSLLVRRTDPENSIVRVQGPIRLSDVSEPQPDLAILRWRADQYRAGHPTADEVLLLIEVADSSVSSDRRGKVPLYARAGIAEVWLVDLGAGRIESHQHPSADGYRRIEIKVRGDSLAPDAFADMNISVDEVLG